MTGLRPRRRWRPGWALGAALLWGPPVAAQAPPDSVLAVQAGATLERDSVTVGDVVRLTVRVRAPKGATISFPAAGDSVGAVQALEPPVVRDGPDTSAADRIATYRLAAWDVGSLPIRLGDVLVQTEGRERRVTVPLPTLTAVSVLPADTALRVPKPARPLLAVRPARPLWWLGALALAALLLLLLLWMLRRRRRAPAFAIDPYERALEDFDRVEGLRLVDAGEPGRHAALMADVVRRYLAARVPAASLAHTSAELLRAARGVRTVPYEELGELLRAVDPIKFGAQEVTSAAARELGVRAREIVREEHDRATVEETVALDPSREAA